MTAADVAIVGSSPNALVAAVRLARAGKQVVVVEPDARVGGPVMTEEFAPGFHGNTDPILVFLVLLTIDLVERRRPAWLAGIALGVAAEIKVLPVLLAPAMLLSLPGTRRRIEFCVGAAAAFLSGSAPFLFAVPELVITRVFGYTGQSGPWGLSLLALVVRERARLSWMGELYVRYGTMLSLYAVAGATLWLRPLSRRNVLFMPVGFVLFLFVAVIPGFGVQYLVWLVPWVVQLGSAPTAAYFLVGTVFLVGYYSSAAGTFPWYVANSLERPAWSGTVLGLGLICWTVVCVITLVYARQLAAIKAEPSRTG